jgi:hypothetical protein
MMPLGAGETIHRNIDYSMGYLDHASRASMPWNRARARRRTSIRRVYFYPNGDGEAVFVARLATMDHRHPSSMINQSSRFYYLVFGVLFIVSLSSSAQRGSSVHGTIGFEVLQSSHVLQGRYCFDSLCCSLEQQDGVDG